jgi:hypothetical protein
VAADAAAAVARAFAAACSRLANGRPGGASAAASDWSGVNRQLDDALVSTTWSMPLPSSGAGTRSTAGAAQSLPENATSAGAARAGRQNATAHNTPMYPDCMVV